MNKWTSLATALNQRACVFIPFCNPNCLAQLSAHNRSLRSSRWLNNCTYQHQPWSHSESGTTQPVHPYAPDISQLKCQHTVGPQEIEWMNSWTCPVPTLQPFRVMGHTVWLLFLTFTRLRCSAHRSSRSAGWMDEWVQWDSRFRHRPEFSHHRDQGKLAL